MNRPLFALMVRAVAAAGTLVVVGVGLAAPAEAVDSGTSTYIVSTNGGSTLSGALARVAGQNEEILPEVGLATADLTRAQAAALDAQPGVQVFVDAPVAVADVQDNPGWALDRLDQKQASVGSANPNHQYWYPSSAGAGVRIYVVDTGVTAALPEFGGRVLPGYDSTTGLSGDGTDCYGHGTQVASVAAGKTAGVAKAATIVSVRVLSCSGSGNQSGVISGLNWIMANNPAGTPAVINLSLAGLDASATTVYSPMDKAVKAAVDAGFFVTAAAGNSSPGTGIYAADACQMSPARVPEAFTVGAVDDWATGIAGTEGRATFSDAGSCVDAWAPGVNVPVITKAGAADTPSGTSFSSPLAAGLAALYLAGNPKATPTAVGDRLRATALTGMLINTPALPLDATVKYSSSTHIYSSASTSPNLLLQSPAGIPDTTVTGLSASAVTRTTATLTWSTPSSLDVRLVVTQGGTTRSVTAPGGTGPYLLTGLTPGAAYSVTADAINQGLVGFGSAKTTFAASSAITAPGLVQSLTASSKGLLAWTAPADNGGSTVTGYRVQVSPDAGVTWGESITATGPSLQLADLASFSTFRVKVAAVNSPGGQGAFTAPASFSTASQQTGAPTGLAVTTNTAAALRLAWTAPADTGAGPVLDYVISYAVSPDSVWTTAAHTASSATGYSVTYPALRTGQTLAYRVQAKTAFGTGPAATVTYTVPGPQADAPTGLAISGVAFGGATLTWVAPVKVGAAPITDYAVAYSLDGVSFTAYSHVASTATRITLGGLTPNKNYTVRVSTVNRYATSTAVSTTFNTLVGTPSAPGSPTVSKNLVLGATLTWSAPTSAGASAVSDYLVSYSLDGGSTYTVYSHAKSTATTLDLVYPSARSLTAYLWKIQAVNSYGTGPGSTVSYTTPSTIASAPRSLSATSSTWVAIFSPSRTTLTWAAPTSAGATTITDYLVTRSTDGGATWSVLVHPLSTATTLTVTTPAAALTVRYRVQAVNSYGPGLITEIQK